MSPEFTKTIQRLQRMKEEVLSAQKFCFAMVTEEMAGMSPLFTALPPDSSRSLEEILKLSAQLDLVSAKLHSGLGEIENLLGGDWRA